MAKLHFNSRSDMGVFLLEKNLHFVRRASLREWQKWARGEQPELVVLLCNHEEGASLREWDCGCSFGCDACGINVRCSDCDCGFGDEADAKRKVSAHLVPREGTPLASVPPPPLVPRNSTAEMAEALHYYNLGYVQVSRRKKMLQAPDGSLVGVGARVFDAWDALKKPVPTE